MSVRWFVGLLFPMVLAVGLSACEQGGVQQGVVSTSAQNYPRETGRVVEIREVNVRRGGSGMNDGTLVGGGVGAAGGAIAGAAISNSVGGAVVGGLLGAVMGGVAGTAIDRNSSRRGIEVTVQKDDGSRVTIAQPDDGDVQMGDRVVIVYNRDGVAKAVRDTGYRRD
jgi:outer membrane lipoprotein SlyB